MMAKTKSLAAFGILSLVLSAPTMHAAVPGARGVHPCCLAEAVAPGSPSMKTDQANIAGWDKAWTNVVNDVEQGFTPSRPKLVGVEVELVVGNPDTGEDELTLAILDKSAQPIASVTQTVRESDCQQTLFLMPNGGVDVTPGDSYRIKLSGGTTFGWKYVVGGYPKGRATFNGKPLLPNAKSSFLFRTFSAD